MDKNNIFNILTSREGYSQKRAILLANECQKLSAELHPLLEGWLQDANNKGDFSVQGYNLLEMMQRRKIHYLAALLDIDWLIKEPERARPVIESFM